MVPLKCHGKWSVRRGIDQVSRWRFSLRLRFITLTVVPVGRLFEIRYGPRHQTALIWVAWVHWPPAKHFRFCEKQEVQIDPRTRFSTHIQIFCWLELKSDIVCQGLTHDFFCFVLWFFVQPSWLAVISSLGQIWFNKPCSVLGAVDPNEILGYNISLHKLEGVQSTCWHLSGKLHFLWPCLWVKEMGFENISVWKVHFSRFPFLFPSLMLWRAVLESHTFLGSVHWRS